MVERGLGQTRQKGKPEEILKVRQGLGLPLLALRMEEDHQEQRNAGKLWKLKLTPRQQLARKRDLSPTTTVTRPRK